MSLFDKIQRSEFEPARYAEPIFAYLNRTARGEFEEMRKMLDDWFSHYPISEQPELRARFRSNIDSQHQSSLFELLLHELLVKLRCQVTPHPILPNITKTPDFLVDDLENNPFYLEATLATNESSDEVAAHARMNTVYDILDRKVDATNFFLWVNVEGAPKSPPPASRIASFINKRLVRLDPDKVAKLYESDATEPIPTWRFEHDDWIVEFQSIPKKHGARNKKGARPIGAQSTGVHWVDHRTPIRDAINKKVGRYGDIDLPYVIAVNVLEFVDEIDIMEALFGKEQFTIAFSQSGSAEPVETQMSRVPDGVWTSHDGPRNTRVSAVLLATRLTPWNLLQNNVRLYHNPWAKRPYSSVLTRLSQAILEDNHMKKVEGELMGTVLDL